MFDLVFLALFISNLTPEQQFSVIDAYVEENTKYQYFYYLRNPKDYYKTMQGDCSDKARLKCDVLRKNKIPCGEVYGYQYGTTYKDGLHAWINVKLNGKWVSSEPMSRAIGAGI